MSEIFIPNLTANFTSNSSLNFSIPINGCVCPDCLFSSSNDALMLILQIIIYSYLLIPIINAAISKILKGNVPSWLVFGRDGEGYFYFALIMFFAFMPSFDAFFLKSFMAILALMICEFISSRP